MNESDRIRAEYAQRAREIPADQYAWNRAEVQFWQAKVARACSLLLRQAGVSSIENFSIADVGCGTGNWLLEFLQWGARAGRVHGIDLLEERVAFAREKLPDSDILAGNAASLPWPDSSMDLVTQFTVFSSILDDGLRRTVASEMLRVLKPGGHIFSYDLRIAGARPAVRALKLAEIRDLFPACHMTYRRVTLIPPLSRLVARKSWTLATALESLPFARTHYAVLLRRTTPAATS